MNYHQLKKYLGCFFLAGTWLCATACTPLFIEGTYKGKVVDEATGEPVEGAVALATWQKTWPTVGGGGCEYYDAQDAVTNEKGEFEIPGQGIRLFTFLGKMGVGVFKAGYRFAGSPDWGDGPKEDGRMVTKLRLLTLEQRKKLSSFASPPSPPSGTTLLKVRRYLLELNKEDITQGLKPRKIWGGEKIE